MPRPAVISLRPGSIDCTETDAIAMTMRPSNQIGHRRQPDRRVRTGQSFVPEGLELLVPK